MSARPPSSSDRYHDTISLVTNILQLRSSLYAAPPSLSSMEHTQNRKGKEKGGGVGKGRRAGNILDAYQQSVNLVEYHLWAHPQNRRREGSRHKQSTNTHMAARMLGNLLEGTLHRPDHVRPILQSPFHHALSSWKEPLLISSTRTYTSLRLELPTSLTT